MDDVAFRASVSQTTVSYVLNGKTTGANIPADTRKRVLEAARDLGYQRNQLARAMVTGRSRIFGVFTEPGSGEVKMNILAGAMEAANNNDYLLKVMHLSYYGIDDSTIARCAEWQIAGAIVMSISEESQQRLSDDLQRVRTPLVMVDASPMTSWGIRVLSDDTSGIRQVVAHLTELGHTKIAYLGGPGDIANPNESPNTLSKLRGQSFLQSMHSAGLTAPESWIRTTSWQDQPIIEAGARLVLGNPLDRPTAIVCASDSIAMIVLRIASSLGLRVPEDLSVTGYSDANLSSFATPPLTTVSQAFFEMGRAATEYLVTCDQDAGREDDGNEACDQAKSVEILTPTTLIARASTARAPG